MSGDISVSISINARLYPSLFSDRYYPLAQLRKAMMSIAGNRLPKREALVLVDMGCGSMPYRPVFEPHVAQYLGVDLVGNEQADFDASTGCKTCLLDHSVDIVLSTQVLEHVANPKQYLDECYRILKPNGLLILSTHGYWMYHPDPTDFWRWTSSGLRKIVEQRGFRVVQMQGIMGLAATAVQLFQDALMPRIPRLVRPLVALVMQSLTALVDKLHSPGERNRDACIFVIVASKGGDNHYVRSTEH